MELRSDQIKRGVARAPHRSLLKADGITDEEMDRPFIAVLSSRNDVIPGHTHLDKIAEAVKAPRVKTVLIQRRHLYGRWRPLRNFHHRRVRRYRHEP